MNIWIVLLVIVTGIYNLAIGGRAILALAQILVFVIGLNEIGLPLTTGRLIASLGGIVLIIHSVQLFLGYQAAQRRQPLLCISAIASRLLIIPIQVWRFPQTMEAIQRVTVLVAVTILLFDIPLLIAFLLPRVRAEYAEIEALRKQRQEDRELKRSIKS